MHPSVNTMRLTILLVMLLLGVSTAKRRKSASKSVPTAHRRQCETVQCVDVVDDYKENCVLNCTSPECYEEVYAAEELEPGEIDTKRQRAFNACIQRIARQAQQDRRSQQTRGGASLAQPLQPADADSDATEAMNDRPATEL